LQYLYELRVHKRSGLLRALLSEVYQWRWGLTQANIFVVAGTGAKNTKRKVMNHKLIHIASLYAVGVMGWFVCGPAAAQQFSAWSAAVNLGPSINTSSNELHPAISADGLSLFFSSDRDGGLGGSDLWVAQRPNRNAAWAPARNLGPSVNTAGDEFGVELSPDGHCLFFCTDGLPDSKGNNLNIFVTFRSDTTDDLGWGQPVNLGKGVNGSHLNCDPTVFVDPETGVLTLYFARLNKPGQGDWDVYVSTLGPDGVFGDATFLPDLSSPYRDTHPTIRRDGLEVIFSSNRPGSIGQIDLWTATRPTTHDTWSTPVNLGAGVNTESDDRAPYLSDDGLTLIFASDRPDGAGGTDLYMMTRRRVE
jgi:WD40-like Beta Propeller Repeat